jgi:peptidoglycan L-alanyl-D-glutamate endopeptidase CwlK
MASRDITLCVPELQEKWPLIKRDIEAMYPGWEARPICTLRSTEEQQALWAQGRTKPGHIVTWVDGINKLGAHNPIPGKKPESRAIDVGIFVNGKYMTNSSYYRSLKTLAPKYGLKSGWSFGDPPHIEVAKGAVIRIK